MADDSKIHHLDAILKYLGGFGRYNTLYFSLLVIPTFFCGIYSSEFIFEALDIKYRCEIPVCESTDESLWIANAIPKEKDEYSKCYQYEFNSNFTANDPTCPATMFDKSTKVECESYVYDKTESSAVTDVSTLPVKVTKTPSLLSYLLPIAIGLQFNLGCQDWKRTMIGAFHNLGLFISLPLTGVMSDKYGRKKALAIASLMLGIFGTLRSFSPNYIAMWLFQMLESSTGAGLYSCVYVYAMELVGPKGRVIGNTIICEAYVCGAIYLGGISWILNDWRVLLRVLYIPAIFVIIYYWFMDESVRWLLEKGKISDAVAILQKAAKMNKREIPEELLTPLYKKEAISNKNGDIDNKDSDKQKGNIDIRDSGREKDKIDNKDSNREKSGVENKDSDREKANTEAKPLKDDDEKTNVETGAEVKKISQFKQAIRSRVIRCRLMVCSFCWITCTFVYYGLSINSVALAGNLHLNFILVATVELPAKLVSLVVLHRFGRKKTLITAYVLSAFLCISLAVLPLKNLSWFYLVIYLAGKFCIAIAYVTVYIYVAEVFPTCVRQSMLAICSAIGRVGSTLAPLTPLLGLSNKNLPAVFFGIIALVASVLVFFLPETNNVALPDNVEEAEALSRKHKAPTVTNEHAE